LLSQLKAFLEGEAYEVGEIKYGLIFDKRGGET
jgi:hypothetical protein